MSNVIIAYRNILEWAADADSGGSVTTSSAHTSYPKYRLYDRDIGKLFKFNAADNPSTIILDQGGVTNYAANRLIIPENHNLNGLACSLRYSNDNFGADDHEAVGWTQSGSGVINQIFSEQTKRYWKLRITAPGSACQLGEMYLTSDYTFEENVSIDAVEGLQRNTYREESISGRVMKVKQGEARAIRRYSLRAIGAAQKANITLFEAEYDGVKNFYVIDHNGDLYFMENLSDIEFQWVSSDLVNVNLDLLEVL